MAGLFSRTRSDEKGEKAPTPVQEVPPGEYSSEEGVVDEAQDDLHRGMKPRQLSACLDVSPADHGAY
jgi:amino acid transporter